MRYYATLFALLIGALWAEPALAEPEPRPAQDQRAANQHFQRGVALYKQGRFAEALAEFQRAQALAPHPLVRYNLIVCYRELAQDVEAVRELHILLAEGEGKLEATKLTWARDQLGKLLPRVARLSVSTSPAGALVRIDGAEVGGAPLSELVLAAGAHRVEVALDGHLPEVRELRIEAGKVERVQLTLRPQRGEPAVPAAPATSASPEPNQLAVVESGDLDGDDSAADERSLRWQVTAGGLTNARRLSDTGAPTLGIACAVGDRFSAGIDVVLLAYAVMPSARVRLVGERVSLHAIAALPLSFADDGERDFFLGGAGGLGLRYRPWEHFSVRLDVLASYAGSTHGFTLPLLAVGELWL